MVIRIVDAEHWDTHSETEDIRKRRRNDWNRYHNCLGIPANDAWKDTDIYTHDRRMKSINGISDCWVQLKRVAL